MGTGKLSSFGPCRLNSSASKDHKIIVGITFVVTILLWMLEGWLGISANIVALIPFAVFTATGVFSKEDLKEIDWSVLWMVAGGFALGRDVCPGRLSQAS